MLKTTFASVGIAVAIVLGIVSLHRPTNIEVNVPSQSAPIVNVAAPDVRIPATVVNVPKQEQQNVNLGAVSTLDGISFPYSNVNGLGQYYYSQNMAASSSVVCSIKNPYSTTTQVLSYYAKVTVNGLGTQNVTLATGTDQYRIQSTGPSFIKTAPVSNDWFLTWIGPATTTANAFVWGNDGPNGQSYTNLQAGESLNLVIATTTPGVFAGGYLKGVCGGVLQSVKR